MHVNAEADVEFWYARELMELLGYNRWENFDKAVCRAMESCKTSGIEILDQKNQRLYAYSVCVLPYCSKWRS